MVSQNNAGSESSRGQYLSDFDLRGYTDAEICNWLSYTRPQRFRALVEAISKGDKSLETKILRRWGIW